MNAFEELVASFLRRRGFWTQVGYKVKLDQKTKAILENRTRPDVVIDVIAYKPGWNELYWVECKTHLFSAGVRLSSVKPGPNQIVVFADDRFRKVVTRVLLAQLKRDGLIGERPNVKYCLAAAHIYNPDREDLRKSFGKHPNWMLFDEAWIGEHVSKLRDERYEDEIAVVVAQLLDRIKETVVADGLLTDNQKRRQT